MIGRCLADDGIGGDPGGILRVLHRFQPPQAAGEGVGVAGAVANRQYARGRAAKGRIDQYAAVAGNARRFGQGRFGLQPDADEDEVRLQPRAVVQDHGFRPVRPGDGGHAAPQVKAHALGAVQVLDIGGNDARGDARQDAALAFHHVHLLAQGTGGCGHFQPDIAAADHHQPPRRAKGGAQAPGIVKVAQAVDAGKFRAGAVQLAGAAAGGQHAPAEAQAAPVRQAGGAGIGADRLHAAAAGQFDPLALPETGGAQGGGGIVRRSGERRL